MEIVFIKPPQAYLFDPERNPPLGLMYVAAVAKNMGHNIRFIDFSTKTEQTDLLQVIPEAELYGFTVSILDYKFSLRLAGELKNKNKCFIVFGGSLVTTAPEQINFDVVDSIILGEGERSFQSLLSDISQGKNLAKIYKAPRIENLDSIEFPLRRNIKFISNKLLEEDVPATTIITSRGCPFNCAFCASRSIWGRKVRFRSVKNVLDEIDFLIENYNIKGLRFVDDTLILRRDHFKKLCNGLKEKNLLWRCSTRSDLITKELAKIMYDSGCKEVGIGVESADPHILEIMNKEVEVGGHERAIKILKDAGIKTACFFITGLPGEKEGTPELNISFIKRTNPERVFCTTFMPYPGTPVWNNPDKYNIKLISKHLTKYNQVSGVGEEDREFVAIPSGLTYEQLLNNRKKMIDWLAQENKIAKPDE